MDNQQTFLTETLAAAKAEMNKVIIGQDAAIDSALIVILSGQHALIEGVPGIAKTLLVRTLARVLGRSFSRIQFTPDLMPADITGTNVFNLKENQFSLQKGPVFTDFLLGDEINRAPAKTQAALLQAMQERCVSIDRETYRLDPSFTVFATQNPIEYEGTYPLPEAQKDRFMMKIIMDYPSENEEKELARRMLRHDLNPESVLAADTVNPVIRADMIMPLRQALETVAVRPELVDYMVDVARATRHAPTVLTGAGPRATQSLLLGSRAAAALAGRDFVIPDDVKQLAVPVLGHRLVLRPEFEIEGLTPGDVINQILTEVAVPT
ncbi:MAG: MoxR family ATPase [Lentisphaeria bacterium]|nr:MoxR family ATPase [Lentisphaeria bacterium]